MAIKHRRKKKHKRMDKKQRGQRTGAIRKRKRERKRGHPKFDIGSTVFDDLTTPVDFL